MLFPDFHYFIHDNNQNAAPSLTFQPFTPSSRSLVQVWTLTPPYPDPDLELIKVSILSCAAFSAFLVLVDVGNSQNSCL